MPTQYIASCTAMIYEKPNKTKPIYRILWGDDVEVLEPGNNNQGAKIRWREGEAYLQPGQKLQSQRLLKVIFVDVGQGDAALIETPGGHTMVIDGGETVQFYRYLRQSYKIWKDPLDLAALVISHGDADHFKGLQWVIGKPKKQGSSYVLEDSLIRVQRVFHNGLVKRKDESLGPKETSSNGLSIATDIYSDLSQAAAGPNNSSPNFQTWIRSLKLARQKGILQFCQRLEKGSDSAFDFLQDGISIKVLGPVSVEWDGKRVLPYFEDDTGKAINGNSVVLRVDYGSVRILFGGDLNKSAEEHLLAHVPENELTADVLKVPHHGSHDFSPKFLETVNPKAMVVSSGDWEIPNRMTDYMHPRSDLLGALGRYGRTSKPLVFSTEVSRSYKYRGKRKLDQDKLEAVYSRERFGVVHLRTDGTHILMAARGGGDTKWQVYVRYGGNDDGIADFGNNPNERANTTSPINLPRES